MPNGEFFVIARKTGRACHFFFLFLKSTILYSFGYSKAYVLPCIQVYFGMLDALLASEELPEEYRDRCQVLIAPFLMVLTVCIFFDIMTLVAVFPGHSV